MKAKVGKHRNLRRRNAITGYMFILPFVIGFLVFLLKPMFESFQMSLSNVTVAAKEAQGAKGFNMELITSWKDSNYYRAFFYDPDYKNRLVDSLKNMAFQVPAILVFSFFIALLLNQEFKGRGFVRAIFFLPVILSSGVIVGLEYNNTLMAGMKDVIAEAGDGISITATLETILRTTGVGGKILDPVFKIIDGVYDVALASGIQIIIFISGLQTVSPSMYEAAKIEGCTAWESFWKITFPLVSSMILVNLVYTVIDFLMRTDNQVMDLITRKVNPQMEYGLSAAMAWSYFAIVAVVLGILALILSRRVYYYE
ncbi:MAG: sugar ABC transporter permease [Lachnospiraceae bacterium]|nr:sugar ABC transporter permease [Lachnospiraceae bacterium]